MPIHPLYFLLLDSDFSFFSTLFFFDSFNIFSLTFILIPLFSASLYVCFLSFLFDAFPLNVFTDHLTMHFSATPPPHPLHSSFFFSFLFLHLPPLPPPSSSVYIFLLLIFNLITISTDFFRYESLPLTFVTSAFFYKKYFEINPIIFPT